jgi:LacI family transcriptional regulator
MATDNRVTIHEVARLAGVSIASVSRALSGANPVSEATAQKVRAAADRLGYKVDPLGQSLRKRKTKTIGLIVADISNPFFAALVIAVEEAAQAAGYGVLLAHSGNNVAKESAAITRLLQRRVDAMFIAPSDRIRSRPAVVRSAAEVPTVQLDRFASSKAHYIGMDNDAAINDLLSSHDRRTFAFVGSDPHASTTWERQKAFVRAAAAIDPRAPQRVHSGTFTYAWGLESVGAILANAPDVDAIICASDVIALGVIEGLTRAGRRVPENVAVAGFDDTLFATLKEPQLTSVRQPLAAMSQAAVALIDDENGQPQRRTMPATIITRASTRSARH